MSETGAELESGAALGCIKIEFLPDVRTGVFAHGPDNPVALQAVQGILRRGKPPAVIHHIQRQTFGDVNDVEAPQVVNIPPAEQVLEPELVMVGGIKLIECFRAVPLWIARLENHPPARCVRGSTWHVCAAPSTL